MEAKELRKFTLDDFIELIIVQFSFTNEKQVPSRTRRVPRETSEERKKKVSRGEQGIMIIPPTPKTEISLFPGIRNAGFELVDLFSKTRPNERNGLDYETVRFTLFKKESARPTEFFLKSRDEVQKEFEWMCHLAIWRVRAYQNPYFKDNLSVPGKKAISINLEVRKPRFCDDGITPFVEWARDAGGGSLGLEPEPVTPLHRLIIEKKDLKLLAI